MLCAQIGSVMVNEAIKLITGIGSTLLGRVLIFNALDMTWRELRVRRDPSAAPITELSDDEAVCGLTPNTEQEPEELPSITAAQLEELLKERAAGRRDFDLIDVREPGEYDIVRIEGATLMPQNRILSGETELDTAREMYVHCKAGSRSANVVRHLREQGAGRVYNVEGGILQWVHDVEPEKPVY